ncbi:MAG: MFS transporter [Coriobacteriales bacterium]|jgi:MFS family permease|nr:MFS transporter [Coriobacteriales bacterium]
MPTQAVAVKNKGKYPWLIPIGFAFVEIATIETILVQSGQFFPPVTRTLGFGIAELALWITFYSFAMAATMPFVGRLLPLIDSRVLLTTCVLVCVLSMAAMGFYTATWQWYLSGVLIGVSGAFVFLVPGPVFINNWFAKRSGFAMGLMGFLMGVGSAIISPVCALLIQTFDWRNAYLLLAGISLCLSLPWTLFIIRFKPEEKGMKPYGWEEGMIPIVAEHRSSPGVPVKRALRTLPFVLLFIACGAGSLYGGFQSNWSNAALSWGYSAMFGAMMITAGTLFKLLFPVIGWIADRIGAYKTAYIYCAFVMLGMVGAFIHSNEVVIIISVFLFASQSVNMKMLIPLLIRETFGRRNFAKIYSYIQIGVGIIGAPAAPIVGFFYDTFGNYDGAFIYGFIVSASILTLLIVSSFARRKLVWEY